MSSEHPIKQQISSIQIDTVVGRMIVVGQNGVTKIEATTKSGMYADIPYLRVWAGDQCLSEFCQHNIVAVNFESAA